MRGAERPAKVNWTRPFLAPLKPLSDAAALQTFLDVADDTHDQNDVKKLLELTGNLPLAVSLVASVASSEGCEQALTRWKSESTRMLSDGYDKRSSLDISIMLSLTSTRMTSGAQELLSVLAILPDGITDSDLQRANLAIPSILTCKATLVRTSLAFIDTDKKIKVLVPIREYMLTIHPPSTVLKLQLCRYFHDILDLWSQSDDFKMADLVPRIAQNLGNLHSVLLDALRREGPDITQGIGSILYLCRFYRRTQASHSPLLSNLSAWMINHQDEQLYGDYLIELFESSNYLPLVDAEKQISSATKYFESRDPLEAGER